MPRTGFEICNHTCGCTPGSKRPQALKNCMIFQKEGSSGRRHAKSATKHPNCTAQCPVHGPNGILTRDPTDEEWQQWAAHLTQAYAHRADLVAMIPQSPSIHTVNTDPSKYCQVISTTSSLKSLRNSTSQLGPELPFYPRQRLSPPELLPLANHLPPGLKRKRLPGQKLAVYVVHPTGTCHNEMSTQTSQHVSCPRLLSLSMQHVYTIPESPYHYFTQQYVSQKKPQM
jgi:hypothetical protein